MKMEIRGLPEPVDVRILYTFRVIWEGWESDNTAHIVEYKGKRKIVMTSHGAPFFADKKQLEERVREYESLLKDTKAALACLEGKPR